MTRRIVTGVLLLVVALGTIWLIDYLSIFSFSSRSTPLSLTAQNSETVDQPGQSSTQQVVAVPIKVEAVVENLKVPWAVVFTSQDRMLVTERSGTIKQVVNSQLQADPVYAFPDVVTGGEIGLMGMTLDPSYATNKKLYVCVGHQENKTYFDKVVSLLDNGNELVQPTTVIEKIPANRFHAGCELAFGPDGKLYVTTGDAAEKTLAQDRSSLAGKILRLNADGTTPEDNPYPNSPVYTYGHRNPQGIAWSPQGFMYSVEHGPSGNDGPGGGDELNLIEAGLNYGWPLVSHGQTRPGTAAPLLTFTPAVAPASLIAYTGDVFPQFKNNLLFGLLRGAGILHVDLVDGSSDQIQSFQKIEGVDVGRVRELTQGPDGYIYFTSSNTDGRGVPKKGDDKIYRLLPVER